MASKRKQNIAFEQKRLNKPQTLQKVLSCIRGYGQPMPLVKLAPVFAKKYGRNSPTIQQVFGCSALELLEGPELAPFVRVTYNTTQRQYYVAPIKNVKDKITKGQTKKQPTQPRGPKVKERTVNAFVEPQPKPALSIEKTLITLIDLVFQSPTQCVQLSEVPNLFKQKTGVDLNFKEKFGTTALKVMERPPLSDHLSVVTGTSTQHWVTLGRNKMLTAVVDLLREMGSDWVHLLALLNQYKQKTGIGLNFPKMFGQSALNVITTHLSDQIFIEEQPKYMHWLALKPEESDELEPQLWDFDLRPPREDESDSEGSDLEVLSPEETLITIVSLVLDSPNKCLLLSDMPRLYEQKTGVVLNYKETFGAKALKAFQRPPLSDHLSVVPGISSQHWVTVNGIEVDFLSQSEYDSSESESDELEPQLWDFGLRPPGEDESDSEGCDLEALSPEQTLITIVSLVLESPNKCVLLAAVPHLFKEKTGVVLNFKETFGCKALKAFQRPPLSDHLLVVPGNSSQHWVTVNGIEVDISSQSEYDSSSSETEDEDEDLDGVMDVTSRIMLDAFAQRPPPRKALKALCARTTKVSRMSLSE